jgi:hypothetical protein
MLFLFAVVGRVSIVGGQLLLLSHLIPELTSSLSDLVQVKVRNLRVSSFILGLVRLVLRVFRVFSPKEDDETTTDENNSSYDERKHHFLPNLFRAFWRSSAGRDPRRRVVRDRSVSKIFLRE